MNEKTAKEIYVRGPSFKLEKDRAYSLKQIIDLSSSKWKEFHEAKGYLECLEKVKGMEESLRRIANADYGGNRPPCMVDAYHALTQWEREK